MSDHEEAGVEGDDWEVAPAHKPMRLQSVLTTGAERPPVSPYLPVAEDLEWLRSSWLRAAGAPADDELRRGSAALRNLLNYDMVQRAWNHHGLKGRPTVFAPDMAALAEHLEIDLSQVVSLVAGGAVIDNLQMSMTGSWRVDNPTTGVKADAEEGFAVVVGGVARDTRGEGEANPLQGLVEKEWRLNTYLRAPAAVRRGQTISRAEIIEFFANYAGGAHLDRVTGKAKPEKRALFALVADLEGRIGCDKTEGLYFELLSIGQALANSPSLQRLAAAIRENAQPDAEPRVVIPE